MTDSPPLDFFRANDLMRMVERYMTPEESTRVYDAFLLAAKAHQDVVRKSGEPYITHPLEVARILADMHLDADAVCAALLHDVIEDTDYTYADIEQLFGKVVADLVEGVTKLESQQFSDKNAASKASFRKFMNATTADFRVVTIKLADRLHNLRTLQYQKPEARRRISKETLKIYIPLAHRMGMNTLRRELQALVFENLYPWRYCVLKAELERYNKSVKAFSDELTDTVLKRLTDSVSNPLVFIPEKNLYRIYDSMKNGASFDEDKELIELRVLVGTVDECYQALGVLHSIYRPLPGKFQDFIATPKSYGYQALQTVLIPPGQRHVLVKIQTRPMYQTALYGITAQWRYPGQNSGQRALLTQGSVKRWQEYIRDVGSRAEDAAEFYDDIQADLDRTEIYAYTPKGELKEFPKGATMIDFAFAIHTEVGLHCTGAKVDGKEVPLRTRIPNFATIEILTDPNALPQPSWLNYAVTGRARSTIRSWVRQQTTSEQLELGKALLNNALCKRSSSLVEVTPNPMNEFLSVSGYQNSDDLFLAIVRNDQCSRLTAQRLIAMQGDSTNAAVTETDTPLVIKGTSGLAIHFQTCCYPLPSEPILATLNSKNGLEVHRDNCPVLHAHTEPGDILSVTWAEEQSDEKCFLAGIQTHAHNVVGVLHHITQLMHNLDVNIESVNTSGDRRVKETNWVLWVRDLAHLEEIIHQVERVPSILKVKRLEAADKHKSTSLDD
jgi:RelA/SpoT family (p)ppGpp synthetase